MLILKVMSFGSPQKGVDRVHNKYIITKRKAGDPLKSTSMFEKSAKSLSLVNSKIIWQVKSGQT